MASLGLFRLASAGVEAGQVTAGPPDTSGGIGDAVLRRLVGQMPQRRGLVEGDQEPVLAASKQPLRQPLPRAVGGASGQDGRGAARS